MNLKILQLIIDIIITKFIKNFRWAFIYMSLSPNQFFINFVIIISIISWSILKLMQTNSFSDERITVTNQKKFLIFWIGTFQDRGCNDRKRHLTSPFEFFSGWLALKSEAKLYYIISSVTVLIHRLNPTWSSPMFWNSYFRFTMSWVHRGEDLYHMASD